jgi:hypothetical protein
MPSMYCISRPGREPIRDVDSVEAVEGTIRAGGPGCYHVDEISSDPLPSGHTSWKTRNPQAENVSLMQCDRLPPCLPLLHRVSGLRAP